MRAVVLNCTLKPSPGVSNTEALARVVIAELEKGTFYILTHPMYNPAITGRVAGIVAGTRPALVRR